MSKIFIIDDEPQIIHSIEQNLNHSIYKIFSFSNAKKALSNLPKLKPEIILLDLNMPEMDGYDFLKNLKELRIDTPVVIISGENKIDSAVKAMKLGAVDFITKPFDFVKLTETINQYMKIKKHQISKFPDDRIIGTSKNIQKVLNHIQKVSNSYDTTILINGETGTGKELVARKIHQLSDRKEHPFIEINCSAIQETLMESELFGHEKGAFTGATDTKKGLLEVANNGTFFLDEIGDMSIGLQAKLLKVLEQKKIRRTGGLKEIDIDVRFLCATSRNLHQLMEENKFRKDLFYRINVGVVNLPPLRERKDDILLIAEHFVKTFNVKFRKRIEGFNEDSIQKIISYSWPGNVRELKNIIERAVLFEDSDTINDVLFDHNPNIEPNEQKLSPGQMTLDQLEKEFIIKTLKETHGHQVKASEKLNISRSKLKHRIKKYNIDVDSIKNG